MLADRHEQLVVEEGDIAKVFVEDVGLGAGAEIASRPITGLQRGRQQAGVFAGRCFFFLIFFLNEPLPGAPRHARTKFRANIRTDCAGPILSRI